MQSMLILMTLKALQLLLADAKAFKHLPNIFTKNCSFGQELKQQLDNFEEELKKSFQKGKTSSFL